MMKNELIETTTKQGNLFYILTLLEDVTMGKYDCEKRTHKKGTQCKLDYKPLDFTLPDYYGDEQPIDMTKVQIETFYKETTVKLIKVTE